jgi:hypothetical protein
MNTKRTLLAGLAGLFVTGLAAFAGPESWKGPSSQKPKGPCCDTCLPAGACCERKDTFTVPSSGRGITRSTAVWCKDSCAMPRKERGCCTTHCVR